MVHPSAENWTVLTAAPVKSSFYGHDRLSGGLTDPSYKGQIIVFTYPLIGNYGINGSDAESKQPQVRGSSSMKRATDFPPSGDRKPSGILGEVGCSALSHVDTRAVVQHIRAKGR
ncbi:carbamoyl-phosphate synthase domain-containing protein [Bacillus licheniformis]|nr:carbamoyl-phosphate synthase domain-containing protein [Bacillus licheniformis]